MSPGGDCPQCGVALEQDGTCFNGCLAEVVAMAESGKRARARRKQDTAPRGERADPAPGEPRTELGYARRLVLVYGDRLRYVPEWRRWLTWDGARWSHDSDGQAARWMKSIARRITADAMAEPDTDKRAALVRDARRAESAHAIAGALTLAGTERELAVSPGRLDADPFLLNTANGTLDLRTMELGPHDPADLLTKITRAAWHPDAASPEWDKFLERVQPDEQMRAFLARVTGISLEGQVSEHLLAVHYGSGANGKSTFFEAVMHAAGDYAGPADPHLLTARSYEAHPTGTADLFGMRLAVLHETDSGSRLAESTVKRLTGGDRIKARRMREDFWWFTPSHQFAMLTNHRPVIGGTDAAIWRRLRLVPWDVQIPAAEQDGRLGERLKLEADAVLRYLVDGYAGWREHGLDDPEEVTRATAQWRGESDALGRFVAERCLVSKAARVRSAELFAAWCDWCRAENEEPGTQTAFSLTLTRHGYAKNRTAVGVIWEGIGLAAVTGDHGG